MTYKDLQLWKTSVNGKFSMTGKGLDLGGLSINSLVALAEEQHTLVGQLVRALKTARTALWPGYQDESADKRVGMYSKAWTKVDMAIEKAEGKNEHPRS